MNQVTEAELIAFETAAMEIIKWSRKMREKLQPTKKKRGGLSEQEKEHLRLSRERAINRRKSKI